MGCKQSSCSQGWVWVVGCLGLLWTTERSEGVSATVGRECWWFAFPPRFTLDESW